MKPGAEFAPVEVFLYDGEEFGYTQDGIVTLILENKDYELYPGDRYHILSSVPHAVINNTSRMAKILLCKYSKNF